MSKKGKGLGKGLSALISDESIEALTAVSVSEVIKEGILEVAISDVLPNPTQPRKNFTAQALMELAQSIKEHGVLQPLVVRKLSSGKYEIVAGERRWRASRQAGLIKVPVIIKELSEKDAMQVAVIENIQREDLNPIEEAEAFQRLMQEFDMTQEEMAHKVGKSRPYIANTLRLLGLNKIVRNLVVEGKISAGHARALLILSPDEQIKMATRITTENLSVRETEKILSAQPKRSTLKKVKRNDADIKAFENELRSNLGTKVSIKAFENGGLIEINFYSDEDLIRLSDILLNHK